MATTIRLAIPSDGKQAQAIYAPIVEKTAISFEYETPSAEEMSRRIRKTTEEYPWLVVDRDGEVLGYAYADRHRPRAAYRWSASTSIYIREDARGRGTARALYGSLFAVLRAQGVMNVYAGITLPNDRSVRLHEALGFEGVGVYRRVGFKFESWHDVGWWQLHFPMASETPAPFQPITALVGSAEFEAALGAGLPLLRD